MQPRQEHRLDSSSVVKSLRIGGPETMRRALIAAAFCAVCGQAAVVGNGTQTVTLAAGTAACAPGGTSFPVKRFNPAYACLSLGSQKAVFDVSTDTMRVVEVAGCELRAWVRTASGCGMRVAVRQAYSRDHMPTKRISPPGTRRPTRSEQAFDCSGIAGGSVAAELGGLAPARSPAAASTHSVLSRAAYKAHAGSTDTVTLSVDAMDGSSLDPQFATAAAKLYAFQDPNGGGRRFIPVYTAIVQAEKGIVTSVSFDEGCFLCDAMSDACVTNGQQVAGGPPLDVSAHRGCAVPADQCEAQPTPNNPDANTCDLKLFIVWTGSDVKGEYLTSVGKRFSRFRSYGMNLGTMWGSIRGISTDALNRLGPRPNESFRRVLRRLGQSHAGAQPQDG